MTIDPRTIDALRVVTGVFTDDGRDFVLIGAMVPQVLIDLRQGREFSSRATRDADAAVKVASWGDFDHMRRRLFEAGFQPGSVPDEYARPIGQILNEERRVAHNERRRGELFRLFRVFAAGLSGGAKSTEDFLNPGTS